MEDPQVQRVLGTIYSATHFTPMEHRLLSSFVKHSVDPKSTAAYLLKRTSSRSGTEDAVELELRCVLEDWKTLVEMVRCPTSPSFSLSWYITKRDRGMCCLTRKSRLWWDVFGWSRTQVVSIIPEKFLLVVLDYAQYAHLRELLLVFLTEDQFQLLRSTFARESPCRNHWTLAPDAAAAFREGLLYLAPSWDIQRQPSEDLKRNCLYILYNTMPIATSLPTSSDGQVLRSGSWVEMETIDEGSFPLPSACFFGIHQRFCNSLRALQIDRELSRRWQPLGVTRWLSVTLGACSSRVFPLIRRLWSYFPRRGRIWVYRSLIDAGVRLYGKANPWTQQVPFGLYIKHGKGKLIPRGEGPALRLVEKSTDIPAPRLVETLVDGDYTYLVMTRLPGKPLMQAIYTMSYPERKRLAKDLSQCIAQLGNIPNMNKASICGADGGPVFDYRLNGRLAGPFESEAEFNNFIITQDRLRSPTHDCHHRICFTHADLNPNNILVESGRLSGIVDFGCAGYFPEYWEHIRRIPSLYERELPTFKSRCPAFAGTFVIDQYKLYPENADFDFKKCVLYLGCIWNGIYDPYKNIMIDVLEFPGISHNPECHIGGVGVDQASGLLSIVVDAGEAFTSSGANIPGTNWIIQWDPVTKEVLYQLNITKTVDGKYGGYQDVEQDPEGNVYVVGTYPSSILKVHTDGKTVTPWYLSPPPVVSTDTGYCGLAAKGWLLLANDGGAGNIVRFDMREEKGVPVVVPLQPNTTLIGTDAIYFPPRYEGTVALVAQDLTGIAVLRSRDGEWHWAEFLGIVPNELNGTFAVAPVQVGEGLYIVALAYVDVNTPGSTSGNRTLFPFVDITEQVDKFLLS
ncbi:uncharacterized protein LY89DRAFT_789984 [Mollisia scopiformis]|uniref:Aminoglycoside phosphotransferase domain-containing protein n=1 Tax=Mollisia scopiformis TaxID=149040 RepID=A0A132B6A8_MOLSC|nr:uncharacterized protein LY89DRAFT_789984 [Mollisia scopiformis]KUJ07207.1 hypothetical protein LY89DRAFT_789984 [Mollisia scopiformis]